MNCPACNVTLLISTRENVEIDYCPQCRGVWLDRGELDKIIERSERAMHSAAPERDPRVTSKPDDRWHDEDDGDRKKRKRKSFFSEMFEFGD